MMAIKFAKDCKYDNENQIYEREKECRRSHVSERSVEMEEEEVKGISLYE